MIRQVSMVVAFCVDTRFARPFGNALASLSKSLAAHDTSIVYILFEQFDELLRQDIQFQVDHNYRNITLKWIPAPKVAGSEARPVAHMSQAAYLRLRLAELLPEKETKIIYLDCDLIIRRSLTPLWNASLGDAVLLAAPDEYIRTVGSKEGIPNTYHLYGLKPDAPFFNSGVLVISLARWREMRLDERAKEYILRHRETLRFADQDVLNALAGGKWGALDGRWNVQVGSWKPDNVHGVQMSCFSRVKRVRNAHILHFTGTWKPWLPAAANPERLEYARLAVSIDSKVPFPLLRLNAYFPAWLEAAGWGAVGIFRDVRDHMRNRYLKNGV